MDALVELLPLLFVGAYYLLANRRKAAQRKQAARDARERALEMTEATGQTVERPIPGPTPFEQFLANLEESLAEAGGVEREAPVEVAPPPPPEPVVPTRPTVERPIPALGSEFSAAPGSFDGTRPVDHEAHGFGAENPFSEERFEQAPAFAARPRVAADYDPHGLREARPKAAAGGWGRVLRDPAAARDAFLLQTVFGPRGGRRADRR